MATETAEVEQKEPPATVTPMNQRKVPRKLAALEHAVMTWHLTPEPEVTLEDLLRPEFWAHTATQLRPGHEVVVFAYDGSWHARLCCRNVTRAAAMMGVISFSEFADAAPLAPDQATYEVTWRGPARRFGVIRVSDREVVKDELPTRDAAESWIRSQMRALAS